ncbi:hypothetical protein QUA82_22965 [Microcoleus sp. F8-D3]
MPAVELTKTFKGGTRHAIDRWNQSQIENRKSSRKRIYLAQVNRKHLKSQIAQSNDGDRAAVFFRPGLYNNQSLKTAPR